MLAGIFVLLGKRYLVEAVRVVETTDERVSESELLHRVGAIC